MSSPSEAEFPFRVSSPSEAEIYTRPAPNEPDVIGWLHIKDSIYDFRGRPAGTASRGCIHFRNVDEIKRAIRALENLIPAVDRLGDISC